MIPTSPPGDSDEASNNSRRDSLAAVAEKIKFQITIEEPEEEENDDVDNNNADIKELTDNADDKTAHEN